MNSTTLLKQLIDDDVEWLFSNEERHVPAGEKVIVAGLPVEAIYLLLEGVLGIFASDDGTNPVDISGPGEIVGEMSFLEQQMPSRNVSALEASTLLVVPHDALRRRAEADSAFAARLYRALALMLSARFRRASNALAASKTVRFEAQRERATWEQVEAGIDRFKATLHAANQAAMKSGDVVPEEISADVAAQVEHLYVSMEQAIGDAAPGTPEFKEQVGIRIQREMLPYLLLTEVSQRTYTKPRGYAGDYLTIELIYDARPGGVEPLGPMLDAHLMELPPSRAVRNRRALLAEEIKRAVKTRESETARITSLACGPAREVFDVFETMPDGSLLKATLVDFDLQALAHVAERRDRLGLQRRMALTAENLIHLALGRKTIDVTDQDLVYSIGLIDYFPDELVVKLLDLIHSMLRPGGRVILGNFHPSNNCKAFMDHVLEWRLVHRTEADMDRLYRSSAFGRDCTHIRFEDQGINMFAECVRSGTRRPS